MRDLAKIQGWLKERFPRHPNTYFGVSGATLLHEAFKLDGRSTVLLPGYICASLSESAAQAGKRLLHADVDPQTMHPDPTQLERVVEMEGAPEAILVIDHAFGYPFAGIARLRQRFPNLLIVEDCARALGAHIHGQDPGADSDWVLLSMYKTTPGSRNGAILLTREPLALSAESQVSSGFRERAAGWKIARWVHDCARRRKPEFGPSTEGLPSPDWKFQYGAPGDLCLQRFARQLDGLEQRIGELRSVAQELIAGLSMIPEIECVRPAETCATAGHFVSFRFPSAQERKLVLTELQAEGFFLGDTWPIVPAHYACYAGTFPCGAAQSLFLADHMAHIPAAAFLKSATRRRLFQSLERLMHGSAGRTRYVNEHSKAPDYPAAMTPVPHGFKRQNR